MDIFGSNVKVFLMLCIAVVAPVALVIWIIRRRVRATRNPQAEAEFVRAGFEVRTSWRLGGTVVKGALHGTPFVLTAVFAADSAAATVVRVPCALGANFALTREGSRDLSGSDLVESTFAEPRAREAVRTLFRLGFDTLILRGGTLIAIRYFKGEVLKPEALNAVVDQLAVIRATSGVQSMSTWMAPPTSSLAILIASIGFLFVGFILFKIGKAYGAVAMTEIWPGIAVTYTVLAALAVFLLRHRPLAGGEIALVILVALPGLFLGGLGVAMFAN